MSVEPESLTSVKWYANVDDCVGGWQVANVDKPASQLDTRKGSGEYAVALFLNEDTARHIVALHNKALNV